MLPKQWVLQQNTERGAIRCLFRICGLSNENSAISHFMFEHARHDTKLLYANKHTKRKNWSGTIAFEFPKRQLSVNSSTWVYIIWVQYFGMLMSFYSLKIRFTRSIVFIQVGRKRLEILQKKLKDHEPISENRGKHNNRPRTIKPEIWTMAKEHLSLIPSSKSHYAYNKTNHRYFQNQNLNQKKLYKFFCTYYKKMMKTNAR